MPGRSAGRVGKAGNETRRELEELLESRSAELDASELGARLAEDAIDVTLPGSPPVPAGALNPLIRTQREIEDIFVGLGYRVIEGPEVELDYYNFTALNHPPGHPARMAQDTFYVDPSTLRSDLRIPSNGDELPPGPEDVVLRTHTSPMQVRSMEAQPPPIFIVVPGRCYRSDPFDATHSPIFHQVEGLAVGPDVTLADLKGTLDEFARAIFGPERETRFRPGFFPFTEPSVEVDVSCFRCGGSGQLPDGSRDPLCKGIGWIEILGAGMVDPNVYGFVRRQRLRPGAGPGLRLRHGDRADRDAQVRRPRPAQVLRERRPRPGAVPMRVPDSWLRAYCDPGLSVEEVADELAMHSIEVERISHVGAPSPDAFVVGKVLSVEKHPDADKLSVCEVDAGDGTRTIVCGAPNVAAGQTVPVALPGAVMPDGTKLGKAKLRGVESNGMILSEAELADRRRRGGNRRVRGRRSGSRNAALGGDPGVRPGDRARADLQSRRLLRRLRRRPRGSRGHRRRPRRSALGAGRGGDRRGRGHRVRLGHRRGAGSLSRASPPGCSPTYRSGRLRSGSRRA